MARLTYALNGKSIKKTLHLNVQARYNIYETKDKKYIALGALEDKFWKKFCNIINALKNSIRKNKQSLIIKKIKKLIKKMKVFGKKI